MRASRGPACACVLAVVAGCAMRSAAPAVSAAPSASSATYTAQPSVAQGAFRESQGSSAGAGGDATRGPVTMPQMSLIPGGAPARGMDGTLDVDDADRARDARITQWEAEIEHQRASMMASLAECRGVCTAAANVCTAALEICRLTGDASSHGAHDARCARAREACTDAGRRRDGACPVCPAR